GCAHLSLQPWSLPRSLLLSGGGFHSSLTLHGLQARNVLAHLLKLIGLRRLASGALHAQGKLLLAHLQQLIRQLGGRLRPQLFPFHQPTCLFTNEVETESFEPARRNASRASTSLTPSISKSTLPGFTRAT